jgi:hypothetical protein
MELLFPFYIPTHQAFAYAEKDFEYKRALERAYDIFR